MLKIIFTNLLIVLIVAMYAQNNKLAVVLTHDGVSIPHFSTVIGYDDKKNTIVDNVGAYYGTMTVDTAWGRDEYGKLITKKYFVFVPNF